MLGTCERRFVRRYRGLVDLQVRPAAPSDAAALAAIAVRAIMVTAAGSYGEAQLEAWAGGFTPARLAEAIASTFVVVAEVDGHPGGFASLVVRGTPTGELDLLYVDPDHGGQGVARALDDAVEAEARQQGCTALVADASLLADPVLQHLGYRVLRRYDKVHEGAVYANTWLLRDLGRAVDAGR